MPSRFDQSTVQQYGGVAWAKQQIDQLWPTAIDGQIQGYNQVKASLNQIVDTLNTANASLQASWSGDASTAASQTFTDTSNHASNVVTTVDNTITQLQNAHTAATNAKNAIKSVPNEVPVPNGGFFGGISNAFSDVFTGTDPTKQAEQHNTTARNQAADVLNKLSASYETSASNMTSIASGDQGSGFTPSTPPSTGAFNLGGGSYGGGSGAAAGYTRDFASSTGGTATPAGVGSVKNGVFEDPHTSLQSATTLPPPATTTPIETVGPGGTSTSTPFQPVPTNLGSGLTEPPTENGKTGPLTEEHLLGEGLGEEGRTGGTSKLGASNVFGEDGFGSEPGGGTARRGSSLGTGALRAEGEPGGGAAGGSGGVAGDEQAGMRTGMGARGAGGAGSEGEQLGSSKYSRGRFFGGDEPSEVSEIWTQPSVGGNESLLIKDGKSGSNVGRVRSAYDGATDAEGNPLHMMRGAGSRGGSHDEDDERGERPGYLKEDPEWWQSAQKVAPPVVE
jgi:uncharacterized protein YukE